jgi:hypothetical protein
VYLQDFFRCEDGKLEEARAIVNGHCPKLVHNLIYEARPLAVRTYMALQGYKSLDKKAGRRKHLVKDEYMQVKHFHACYSLTICHSISFDVYETQLIN